MIRWYWILTDTRNSISRVSRMTGTVERSLGVGAVSINMTVMGVVIVMYRESLRLTLVDIYKTISYSSSLYLKRVTHNRRY